MSTPLVMNLDQWMTANGLSDAKVAELTGMHRTAVWKLRKGMRKPGPTVMDKLVSISHGVITRHQLRPDLYPIDTDTSPKKHQAAE
jgi:hypothetical protein